MPTSPSAAKLLDAWEQGRGQSQPVQALLLLQFARPGVERAALECLTIGQRNVALLALRAQLFGPNLAALAACPHCAETLELSFRTDDILTAPLPVADAHAEMVIVYGDRQVRCRPLHTADLLAVAHIADARALRSALLARCVDSPLDGLPEALLDAIVAGLAEADPQADVRLNLTCPACTHVWQAPFDIVSFLWREVDDWAERTLREVHLLASVYGWRESDTLSLSAQRRRLYLDMING